MLAGLEFCSHKIYHSLTDSPDTRISFAGRPEELDHFGRECRGVEQEPAFVENGNARLPRLPAGAGRYGIRNQNTHGGFPLPIRAQSFDIEEKPIAIEPHSCVSVTQLVVDAL